MIPIRIQAARYSCRRSGHPGGSEEPRPASWIPGRTTVRQRERRSDNERQSMVTNFELSLQGGWLLIPLAVLWSNLHGVEYPVMLLILGAYFTEFVYELIRAQGTGARLRDRYICAAILTLSAFAVFCNPRGIALLAMPFKNIGQVSGFIYELRPLSMYDFISFFGILFLLGWFAAITAFRRRSMRISHLILFLGGLALLTEAKRFVNEYALLALPVLAANIPIIPSVTRAKRAQDRGYIVDRVHLWSCPFFSCIISFTTGPGTRCPHVTFRKA